MKSKDLGLPIEYILHPEYFDIPSDTYYSDKKNSCIEHFIKKYNAKSVLDMTCGTGSQVFHLLKLGYHVLGSDFSSGLIEIAKKKAAEKNISAEFICGDMRSLQVGQFDAVITIDNAIGHLVKSDFELALNNIKSNLKKNGIYIFDILNLSAMTDEVIKSDSNKMTKESKASNGAIIHNSRNSTIDRDAGILTADEIITIQENGNIKKIKNKCSLQIYTIESLNELLLRNGFKVIEQYKIDAYTFQQDDAGYSILTVAMNQ